MDMILLKNKLKFLEKSNVLILDLETTGFPTQKSGYHTGADEYYDYKDNSKYDSSRIVQIAWTYIENFDFDDLDDVEINCFIRKPKDFDTIPQDAMKIHGISFGKAKKEGILLSKIINHKGFSDALINSDYIIAHNAFFDVFILLNELYRLKFNECVSKLDDMLQNDQIVCTAEYSRDICQMNSRGKRYKMPKLVELYKFYYGYQSVGNHNAANDVDTLVQILKYDTNSK